MTVSNEDREAAIDVIYETACFNESFMDEWHKPTMGSAMKIVDTLVSHGWGPRPAVTAAKLGEHISNRSHACPKDHAGEEVWVVHPDDVVEIVRECGIEVTEK